MHRWPVLLILALQPACLRTTVDLEETVAATPTYERSHSFFLGGLIPEERRFKSSELCGPDRRLQRLETVTSGLDGFLEVITLEIYAPKTLRAWCGA